MAENDRDSILSMLMDVTGTTKHVNDGLDLLKELNFYGRSCIFMPSVLDIKNDMLDANEKVTNAFMNLENSLKSNQSLRLKRDGFAFMEHHQLEKFYEDQG